jgi:hypothetical protein
MKLMPGSSHILVTSFLVFLHLGCVIFCTMFSICMQDEQDEMKNKQTITQYFGKFLAKNNQNEVTKMR